jgi:hypothetical protein
MTCNVDRLSLFSVLPDHWVIQWSLSTIMLQRTIFLGLGNFISGIYARSRYWSAWATVSHRGLSKMADRDPLALILAVVLNVG